MVLLSAGVAAGAVLASGVLVGAEPGVDVGTAESNESQYAVEVSPVPEGTDCWAR